MFCLAFPGKIISIKGDEAIVDFDGIEKEINVSLVADAGKGDFVIVHAGFAIQKLSEQSAQEVFKIHELNEKSN
ncbi:MAG: HypC/HybG/HupF family hydrogenase formation chaperone [bacterium]|nr:HypC/HybG/HupF family hydrogenase formation chaperone [bacterium]